MGDVRASRVDAGWPGAGDLVGLPVAAASTVLCVAAYDNRPGLVEVGRGACVGEGESPFAGGGGWRPAGPY